MEFKDNSVEEVNSIVKCSIGIACKTIYGDNEPLELKLDYDKKLDLWSIDNIEKFKRKVNIPSNIIDELNEYVAKAGRESGFAKKKIYLKEAYQYSINTEFNNKTVVANGTNFEDFPCRFVISQTK